MPYTYKVIKVFRKNKVKRRKAYHKRIISARRRNNSDAGFGFFKSAEQQHKDNIAKAKAIQSRQQYERVKREYEVEHRQLRARQQEESAAQRQVRIAKFKERTGQFKQGISRTRQGASSRFGRLFRHG